MRCESESRELRLACADTTQAIQEKQSVPVIVDLASLSLRANSRNPVAQLNGDFTRCDSLTSRSLSLQPSRPCRGFPQPLHSRLTLDKTAWLRLGRFALLKWREQIDRNGKKRRGVMLAGNFAHRLQEAQLQRNRLLAHHRGC